MGASAGFGVVLALWIAMGAIGRKGRQTENEGEDAASVEPSSARSAWAACAGIALGGFWTPFFQTGAMVPLAVVLALGQTAPPSPRERPSAHPPAARLRRGLGVALALSALGLIAPTLAQRGRPVGVYVWREAENAETIEAPAAGVPCPDASGGAALAIARGVGAGWRKEAGGNAAYDVEAPETGDYDLWARTQWTDGCRNSFFVRCNDGKPLTLGNDAVYGEWHWLPLRQVPLRRGKNRIEFANREDGVALDKLLITSDARFAPQGKSEAVFSRDLGDQPLIGWTIPPQSPWRARRSDGFSGLVLDSRPSAPADVLLSSPTEGDFQLDCRFRLLSAPSDLICYFLFCACALHWAFGTPMRPNTGDGLRVDRLIAGDEAEWRAFVHEFSPLLRGVVARTLRGLPSGADLDDLDELVQDVFVRLLKNGRQALKTFDPARSSLRTWLTVLAHNTACDHAKRPKPTVVSVEDIDAIPVPARPPRQPLEIPEGLVSPAESRALHCLFVDNMTPEEAAAKCNVAVQTVYALKSKAINKWRRFLLNGGRP
ncbi:MAG: sigma-70 family RNA polymerase sigma factor [Candidatus Sumerlaeota bacterium]|nr:sigma-70 family RNA polymerase sigma factor [Candidatus Sumerlaeota bacterium]